ncbi:polysaccharide pyruvyl transferase family protein [Zoogloea sp.]|uniref:polysaccharide pyruvyl transferase family protein n=1 Tax=Zoogloea sp. TaxID=49181 RepID=UPI0031FBED7E
MARNIQIGLLWHNYPSENLGVGALSYSNIALLDKVLDELGVEGSYFIAGMMPVQDNEFSSVTARVVDYRQFSLRAMATNPMLAMEIRARFSKCDLVLDLSEGDSFTDIYGAKRLVAQTLSKFLALSAGAPLVLSPQTIGPFETRVGKFLGGRIMSRSKCVFARDEQSFNYVRTLAPVAPVELVTDLAFALPYTKGLHTFRPDAVHFGFNVSGLLYSGGYGGGNQFGLTIDYKKFVEQVLEKFSSRPDVQVHLVPHVISDRYEIEDDYRLSEKLCAEYKNCVISPKFRSPVEAKSYISSLDFFSGARMHATIAAFSSGVPVVPVAYSRKFAGLFGSLGYECLIDGKADSTDSAVSTLERAFAGRDELRAQVSKGNQEATRRLGGYSGFLRKAIGELSHG